MSDRKPDYQELLTFFLEHAELSKELTSGKTHFDKGDYIYMQDDEANDVYIILKGKVKIGSYLGDDKDIVQDILTDWEIFNESALMNYTKRSEYALAMENVELSVIPISKMSKLLIKHPELNLLLMKIFSDKMEEKQNRLEALIFKNSRTRIIEFLINSVRKKGQRIGYEWVIRNFYTHQDIASLTSTSRQSVTTLLNDLRNKNIIQFDRKRILIRDLDLLKAENNQ
jgi:CRP/FNR family cyclic AMP-dependent transcriptional regulator